MNYDYYLKTYAPDFGKLEKFGFRNDNGRYVFRKDLSEAGLYAIIKITQSSIEARVIDSAFDDDFLPFSIKDGNSPVKCEVENFIGDIIKTCFVSTDVTKNLISELDEKYGKKHEEPWDDLPGYYTFKAPVSLKWYAVIMHLSGKKIGLESDDAVDIVNVKIKTENIAGLVDNKQYFPSYHMNKKNWITVLLDKDTDMEKLKELIDDSFNLVEKPKKANKQWLVPANPKYYDLDKAISESPENFIWKQSNDISAGDIVYLYVAAPVSAIKYKCRVLKTYIPYEYADENVQMKYVMQLKLLKEYSPTVPFERLKKFGVNAVRGPRSVPEKLSAELEKH